MIEALVTGERDPQVLADLGRGRMRVKHAALVQALPAALMSVTSYCPGSCSASTTLSISRL
jgi:hypothetical protein